MTEHGGKLLFNGVNGSTGTYFTPAMTVRDLAQVALSRPASPRDPHFVDLVHRKEARATGNVLGVITGVDDTRLDSAGWGVVFPEGRTDLRAALKELLDWRREQATQVSEQRFGDYVYKTGWSKQDFLSFYDADLSGPVNPDKMPYYLLLVGSPQDIPYRFQYQLDVQYAVGRIFFDTLDEYARYAHSVVEAEQGKAPPLPHRAVFFGPHNNDDAATELSAGKLVRPLAELMRGTTGPTLRARGTWEVQDLRDEAASKEQLARLLGGPETPALLFTAGHGMGFDRDDVRQVPHQGALLCQDWPGPLAWRKPIPPDFYFAADDLSDNAQLHGLIAFHFACFSAGTPQTDDFNQWSAGGTREIAPHDFLARLPQRMLAHPRGGALAVVGHIDRAWPYSFWEGDRPQHAVYKDMLLELMREGKPIGAALDQFNLRYAEIATDLSDEIEQVTFFRKLRDDLKIAGMWMATNDSRNYIVIGDPAVRLRTSADADQDSPPTRYTISRLALPPDPAPPDARAELHTAFEDFAALVGAATGDQQQLDRAGERLIKAVQTYMSRDQPGH